MPKLAPKSAKVTCAICGQINVTRTLPREIGRDLFHQEITLPANPDPKKLKVAVLRITYERSFTCAGCAHQWVETFETEKQKHV